MLVTLGRDDASAGSTSLKLWGLDGVRAGGAPACQRTLRCFAPAGKTPEVRPRCIRESWDFRTQPVRPGRPPLFEGPMLPECFGNTASMQAGDFPHAVKSA